MKHKEWKVGLSLLGIISITVFAYFDGESKPAEKLIIKEPILKYDVKYFELEEDVFELKTDCAFGDVLPKKSKAKLKEGAMTVSLPDPQADLDSGLVRIYIPGGLVSQPNQFSQLMKARYDIDFWEEGCVRLYPEEYLMTYNATVFAYLDEKYGLEWREFLVVDTY
ncbi:MAG: hypothetical protein AAFN10_14225 [Bacteroidota bacterium]